MIGPEPAGTMVDANGVGYHVITMGPELGTVDTAPLVFLHGGGPGCTAWTDFGAVAPLFAEHTDEILTELGRDTDQILQLKVDGVVT